MCKEPVFGILIYTSDHSVHFGGNIFVVYGGCLNLRPDRVHFGVIKYNWKLLIFE